MKWINFRTVFLMCIAFWVVVALAIRDAHCATIYYDNSTGGSGSQGSPKTFKTSFQTDYNAASCGDTFLVKRDQVHSYTTDGIILSKTGCSSGSKITLSTWGTGSDPVFRGDRVVTTANSGDNFAWIRDNVDYHEVYNWDIELWKMGWTTGSSRSNDGESASHDGEGRINGWVWDGADATGTQTAWLIYGDDNAVCGPGDGCTNPPAGASGNLTWRNLTAFGYQGRGFKLRNGVGGSGNEVLFDNVHTNGGGASYDRNNSACASASNPGQAGFDWGFSSSGNDTPDSYITWNNCTSTDNNNRLFTECSNRFKQGDGWKGESGSHHIVINGGYASNNVDSGIDSKSDLDVYDFVSFGNVHNFKSYSTGGKEFRCHNCLGHTQQNIWGIQDGAQVKTFGVFTAEDSTFFDNDQDGTQIFNCQTDFNTCSVETTNTIAGFGSGLGSSLAFVNLEATSGGRTSSYTNNDSGVTYTTGDTPVGTSANHLYDGEGGSTSGTDPAFNDRNSLYNGYDVTGDDWHPTASSYLPDVGYREASPVTPYAVLDAPTGFNAVTVSSTAIDLSWANSTPTSLQPFQTSTIIQSESPVGGGFSTLTTLNSEMVVSGGFEDTYSSGVETNWTTQDTDSDSVFSENTSNPYAGSSSQSATFGDFDDKIYQAISGTSNGTIYNSGCWYYTDTPEYFKFAAQENGGSFTVLNSTTLSAISTWDWAEFQWTATATTPRLKIYGASGITGNPTILIDNCSTAPATLTQTYSATGLTAGTAYNFKAASVNTIGTSDYSAADSDTTSGGVTTENPRLRGCSFRGISYR